MKWNEVDGVVAPIGCSLLLFNYYINTSHDHDHWWIDLSSISCLFFVNKYWCMNVHVCEFCKKNDAKLKWRTKVARSDRLIKYQFRFFSSSLESFKFASVSLARIITSKRSFINNTVCLFVVYQNQFAFLTFFIDFCDLGSILLRNVTNKFYKFLYKNYMFLSLMRNVCWFIKKKRNSFQREKSSKFSVDKLFGTLPLIINFRRQNKWMPFGECIGLI